MNSHQNASRITDVVPANFLCDNQTMQTIADSQLSDEKALYAVEANLSVLESRQRHLKEELESVERLILEAVAEQTRLCSSIKTHKSLLAYSPVRALPGEVLSEIFLHYIALSQARKKTVFQEIVASHRIHTPILQVCRRWRTTALADLRLWTTVPLIGSAEDFDNTKEQYAEEEKSFAHPMISGSPQERALYWEALERKLKRISSLPLQLLFHFDECAKISNRDDTISSLQTFIRLFPRASTISLRIHTLDDLIPEFKSLMDDADIGRADQVHTARIEVVDEDFAPKVLAAIPNVEVLEVECWNIDQWFVDVPTAGHRLRSFHLAGSSSSISLEALLDLLDRAPLLETLRLSGVSVTHSVGTLRVMLLSTFHLSHVRQEENDAIFGHLTFPALRSFSYGSNRDHWPRPNDLSFLQRSGCMLTELAFRRCLVDVQQLAVLLTTQNNLTNLQLNLFADGEGSGTPIRKSILEFLSVKAKPKGASRPLPALTVFRVSVHLRQLKAVKRLIESRSTAQAKKCGIATLREVDIEVQTKQSEDDIKRDDHTALFKALTSRGMVIRIFYRYVF